MRPTDLFDDYLQGKLSEEERSDFELSLQADESMANAFAAHSSLLKALEKHNENKELRNKLTEIHEKEFGRGARLFSLRREDNFARRHGKTIAVAASTAFIAVLGTVAILSTGGFLLRQQSNEITELQRHVMELKSSSDGIVEGLTKSKKIVYAPANLEGSAFALNNKGYVITSLHMVKGADSIFIQNANTERALASLVISDPGLDLAILKVDNAAVVEGWQVPFSLKEKQSEIGEKVFTLGYPRKEMVYGEGSVSALSGFSNDTSMYQISIPVNPGNSGGPLLDENGNIIGVVKGKMAGSEGTGFAIKANNILLAIEALAADTVNKDILSNINKKSPLKGLKRSEQVRKINPYVFNVLVYKKD